jgi:outer membrane protein OmpA-like peptidoglycan-associated protein
MNMKRLLLAVLVIATVGANAQKKSDKAAAPQGIITNGNFDDFEAKELKAAGLVTLAKPWMSPNDSKGDLFSKEVKSMKFKIPANEHGFQDALSGSSYAGFRAYSKDKDVKKSRTYLQIKLNQKLVKGQQYCIRYSLSLSDLSKFAVNNVGVYISEKKLQFTNSNAIMVEPQITISDNIAVNITDGWENICGTYTAVGGEEYIVIGGFGAEDKMKVEKMKKSADTDKKMKAAGITSTTVSNDAYYYIDNVDIVPVEAKSQCDCAKKSKPQAQFIYSSSVARATGAKPADIINATVVYFAGLSEFIPGQFDSNIEETAALLKANPALNIELIGHSDVDETAEAKLDEEVANMAQKRAISVKEALVGYGISASRISVSFVDDSQLANTFNSPSGHAQNRRVVFKVK